jgi:hypothetical protein
MVIIVQPMLHLPGHFKTYTSRFICGFLDIRMDKIIFISSFSKNSDLDFIKNNSDFLKFIPMTSRHPFLATIDAVFKLFSCNDAAKSAAIYFLDYHFVAMVFLYPLLRCRFKNIVLTHPGSTFPLGKLGVVTRLKANATKWCAIFLGKIATYQVYHSELVKIKYFRPLINSSKCDVIEWGVIKSKFQYNRKKNQDKLKSNKINILAFGKIEKRKGLSAFLNWIEKSSNDQVFSIKITLLGVIDSIYKNELLKIIEGCKNIEVLIKDYNYTDQELQTEVLDSHYALLAYDKKFTAASGVLADVIGFGIPILTCKECVFSDFVTSNNVGYSIKYDGADDLLINNLIKYYIDEPWDVNIDKLSTNTWGSVAERHLDLIGERY